MKNSNYPWYLFVVRTTNDTSAFIDYFHILRAQVFPYAQKFHISYSPEEDSSCKETAQKDSSCKETAREILEYGAWQHPSLESLEASISEWKELGHKGEAEIFLEKTKEESSEIVVLVTHQANLIQVPMILSENGYEGWQPDKSPPINHGSFYFASSIETMNGSSKLISFFPG